MLHFTFMFLRVLTLDNVSRGAEKYIEADSASVCHWLLASKIEILNRNLWLCHLQLTGQHDAKSDYAMSPRLHGGR